MNQLTKFLVDGILNEGEQKTLAAYGGGFKPPTSGHFEVVKQALKDNPEIDEFIIYVGSGTRNGISQAESVLIWEIYQTYLPMKVKIEPSKAPIGDVLRLGKNNPQDKVYFVIGAREGNEGDLEDIKNRTRAIGGKHPNMEVKVITTKNEGMSGTNARKAAKVSFEDFVKFLPTELSDDEKETVYNIVKPVIKESLNEGKQVGTLYHYTSKDGLKGILKSNSIKASEEYYLGEEIYYISFTRNKNFHKKGMKFNVKTDYRITLDGDKLSNRYKIQPFAYIPGWSYEDSWEYEWLEDEDEQTRRDFFNVTGDYDEQEERIYFKDENGEIPNIKNYIIIVDKTSELKESLNENASYSQDIDIKQRIMQLTQYMLDKGMNIEPLPSVELIDGDSVNAREFFGKTAYYDPNSATIMLYTEGRHPKDIVRSFSHEMIHHIQNLEGRLDGITTTNTQEDDHLNDIEAEANLKGTMTFRNWTDSLNENIDNQLKQYIDGDVDVVDAELLNNLLKFKSTNPKDFDPRTGGNEYGYRGMTFDKDFIKTLKVKNQSNGTTEYEVPSDTKITSKSNRGFLSFSTDEEVAKGFGHYSGYVDHNSSSEKVGGYVKVSLDNPNFILHPDYVSKLSQDLEYSKENEKETLYIGNSFNPESIYVIDKNWTDSLNENVLPQEKFAQETNRDYIEQALKILPNKDKYNLKDYTVEILPIDKIKPTQFGEDYINASSEYEAEQYQKYIDDEIEAEDLRREDFYPIVVDKDTMEILDGNHRHAVHTMLSIPKIKAILVSKKLNEANKPYKHKHGFDDKLGNDPFGISAYARELASGLEEEIEEGRKKKKDPKKGTGKKPKDSSRRLYTDEDPKDTIGIKFRTKEDIVDTLNKKSFEAKSHARQSQIINLIHQRVRAAYGKAKDPDTKSRLKRGLDYITKRKESSKKKTQRLKNQKNENVAPNHDGKAAPYGSGYKEVKENIKCSNCGWEWELSNGGDDPYLCHKCGNDNKPNLMEGRYDTITNKLSKIIFEAFKDMHDRGEDEGEISLTIGPNDEDIISNEFEFDLEATVEFGDDDQYGVDGGANVGFDDYGDEVTPLISVRFKIPKNPKWNIISFDIKDVVRHELEHLTQEGENLKSGKFMKDDQILRNLIDMKLLSKAEYFKLEKEVDAMLQGMYFKAKKSKTPFKKVLNDYLDIFVDQKSISKEEKDDVLNIWRSRRKALSLPPFE